MFWILQRKCWLLKACLRQMFFMYKMRWFIIALEHFPYFLFMWVFRITSFQRLFSRGSDRFKWTSISPRSGRTELSQVWSAWPNCLTCGKGEHDGVEPVEQFGNHGWAVLYASPKPHGWWSGLQFAIFRWNGGRWALKKATDNENALLLNIKRCFGLVFSTVGTVLHVYLLRAF